AHEQRLLAEQQERAARRQRRLTLGVVGVAVLTVIAAVAAWIQSRKAVENQREARRQLAEANWLVGNEARGPGFATSEVSPIKATHYLLKAAAALRSAGAPGLTRDALLAARQSGAPIVTTILYDPVDSAPEATCDPTGKIVVTWGDKNPVRFWKAANLEPLPISLQRLTPPVPNAAFSPDGLRFLTLSVDIPDGKRDVAQLWDVPKGEPVGDPMRHPGATRAMFSRDGQYVLTWGVDGQVRRWRTADGKPVGVPIRHGITTGGA